MCAYEWESEREAGKWGKDTTNTTIIAVSTCNIRCLSDLNMCVSVWNGVYPHVCESNCFTYTAQLTLRRRKRFGTSRTRSTWCTPCSSWRWLCSFLHYGVRDCMLCCCIVQLCVVMVFCCLCGLWCQFCGDTVWFVSFFVLCLTGHWVQPVEVGELENVPATQGKHKLEGVAVE